MIPGVWSLWRFAVTLTLSLCLIATPVFINVVPVSASDTSVSDCTLAIFDGTVYVIEPGETDWELATDDIILATGAWVHTGTMSSAMLTFFDGSTITLDANTSLEVRQLSYDQENSTTIIRLKHWLGRTFSRVVKMFELGSSYEVETPSAVAVVRGTQFFTEVKQGGATSVHTTEGLVSVIAQEEEVQVGVGHETVVEPDNAPTEPVVAETPPDIGDDTSRNSSKGKS
ncbi:FecR domain-containing protein, partial [Chloroflexota bacterium]